MYWTSSTSGAGDKAETVPVIYKPDATTCPPNLVGLKPRGSESLVIDAILLAYGSII